MKKLIIISCLTIAVLLGSSGLSYALPECRGSYNPNTWTNCVGAVTFSNGNKYVGEFKDNTINGQGTFTDANGRVQEGIWKDDKFLYAQKFTPTVTARKSSPPSPSAAEIENQKLRKEMARLKEQEQKKNEKLRIEVARLTQRNQPRQVQKAPPSKVTSWGGRQVIINLDDVMENATVDLWRDFPPRRKFKIAVSNQKPAWMKLSSSAFRRANNALERALNRTGKGRGNRLLARSVLLNVIKGLEKNGLGKDPDSVRRALLKNTDADVLIIADYYEANGGVDMSLQAVRIKNGEIISSTRERKLKFGIPR
jgi:hypothetical protein